MKKIVLVNHKGGVGKTTSAINIAAGLARKGYKSLLIDADPQANLSASFGVFEPKSSIYDSFSTGDALYVIDLKKNLSIVPSSLDFAGIELEIASRLPREIILKKLIKPLENKFDYCIIDCPPSLGLITLNALVAASEVYIPLEAEYLAYRGIDSIVKLINLVKEHYNPKLEIKGVFFTKYNGQRVLTSKIRNEVEKYLANKMMQTTIRVNVALAEAQAAAKDIFDYDSKSNGAADYKNLMSEMLIK